MAYAWPIGCCAPEPGGRMKAIVNTRRTGQNGIGQALSALILALALAGCGSESPQSSNPTVSGVVSNDAVVSGTVTLKDSSAPAQEKTTSIDSRGSFSFDVGGLTPPYFLKAELAGEAVTVRMHSVAPQAGTANINPITDAAVRAATYAESGEDDGEGSGSRRSATSFESLIQQLQSVLKPCSTSTWCRPTRSPT